MHWFTEPYAIAASEIRYLVNRNKESDVHKEKYRINQLILFNIIFMLMYSIFFLGSITYIILSFFVAWYGFLVLVITIPMMVLAKAVQKKRYLSRRDAFIKDDPNLINHR
ncbi:hypothetical protein [Metabacillus sp. FJAT-52054]|uniref:Uncharacterized protein n=1 Tax=Metabacillus sediminis TaxID=3117746 RepID=A0ABZ2NI66_9BACI